MPITSGEKQTKLPRFLSFWGKARPSGTTAVVSHPVVFHLLDVAAVADAILTVRPLVAERCATLLKLPIDVAHQFLVYIVALHDLGKFGQAFVAKCPELWPVDILGPLDAAIIPKTPHTSDGFILWQQKLATHLVDRLWPGSEYTLDPIMQAVFGHHGKPVTSQITPVTFLFGQTGADVAQECADVLLELLHPDPIQISPLDERSARIASWWIAGLVTLADWIGSRQEWFPYCEASSDLAAYWQRARRLAAKAVRRAGIISPPIAAQQTFQSLTGKKAPSPVQQWAETVSLPEGPLLIIIEDVTGAGKTEAAQMLVHRLMVHKRVSGAFWGLPTQATSNAMYARQRDAITALFATDGPILPSLALAHGQAPLHEGFRSSVLGFEQGWLDSAVDREISDDENSPSSAVCAAFLADDRRASLLADIGVGTVDQAFLGILPSKFNTLRLFGLADKVLIIDEAHAYDSYMEVELHKLLHFQAALGGSAIVLSATLTDEQRRDLINAWHDGIGAKRPRLFSTVPAVPLKFEYPLATIVSRASDSPAQTALEAAPWSIRSVPVRFIHSSVDAIQEVVRAAKQGAAVVWIRNTVDSCISAATALRAAGIDPLVFHARFAQGDRQLREAEVLSIFGEKATPEVRRGRVLVATQVVEQSLDLDFDVLISDLAPIDLIVQRTGRLWRHRWRDAWRPPAIRCELVVLAPPWEADPTPEWLNTVLPWTQAVYRNPGVLWRTFRVLQETRVIETPEGLRHLIGAVYSTDDCPDALRRTADRADGEDRADASIANLTIPDLYGGYDGGQHAWMSELHAMTRLGDNQTTVRLGRIEGKSIVPWFDAESPEVAWALSEIRLSGKRVPFDVSVPARYTQAVNATCRRWREFEQDIPLLPLERGSDGVWHGELIHPKEGKPIGIQYDPTNGAAFELGGEEK